MTRKSARRYSEKARRAAGICLQQLRKQAANETNEEERFVFIMTTMSVLSFEVIVMLGKDEMDAKAMLLTWVRQLAEVLKEYYEREQDDDDDNPTIQ